MSLCLQEKGDGNAFNSREGRKQGATLSVKHTNPTDRDGTNPGS